MQVCNLFVVCKERKTRAGVRCRFTTVDQNWRARGSSLVLGGGGSDPVGISRSRIAYFRIPLVTVPSAQRQAGPYDYRTRPRAMPVSLVSLGFVAIPD